MSLDLTPQRFLFLDVAMKYGLWAGDVEPTEFYDPINFTKLEITPPPQEIKRIVSRMEGTAGVALATRQRATGEPGKLDCEFDRAPVGLIALALGATVEELSVADDDITDEAVTTALNLWVPLANRWIDAETFVLETDGTPDVVVDASKYELDAVNGLVKAIHADAVGAKLATYSVIATAGEIYNAGLARSDRVKLVGTGTEYGTKRRCRIIIERVSLAAKGAFDFISGDALKGALTGELELPTGATSPWRYEFSDWASPY